MSEISTKLEKMGRTSTLGRQGEEEPELSVKCWLGLGEEEGTRIYRRALVPAGATSFSTGWWLEPVLNGHLVVARSVGGAV